MSGLTGSYLRVIFEGEVYFVVGEGIAFIPMENCEQESIVAHTFLIAKLEQAVLIDGREKLLEVYPWQVTPLVSEVKSWLLLNTDL